MPNKDIIVIGASSGGIEALQALVSALPANFDGAIFVVIHIGPYGLNTLSRMLEKAGKLPATTAKDWEEFRRGHIYVAPADHHLILESNGYTRLTRGPRENRTRPAVDPLFRSAAAAFGPRVVGVVMSGFLDDGTAGLWAIKERGGIAIVQDPQEAQAPGMPQSALANVAVDHCLPVEEIARVLVELTNTPTQQKGTNPVSKSMETEVRIALEDNTLEKGFLELGEPSVYACPECHGVLLQIKEGSNVRFRCHTGHAYSVETLLADFNVHTEGALWSALRSIEETILLLHRMTGRLREHKHESAAQALEQQAAKAQARADLVRKAVMAPEPEP